MIKIVSESESRRTLKRFEKQRKRKINVLIKQYLHAFYVYHILESF